MTAILFKPQSGEWILPGHHSAETDVYATKNYG